MIHYLERYGARFKNIAKCKVKNFVTNKHEDLFQIFNVPLQFMNKDPGIWIVGDNFYVAHQAVVYIKLVNNLAERAVAFMHEFNMSLTQNNYFY